MIYINELNNCERGAAAMMMGFPAAKRTLPSFLDSTLPAIEGIRGSGHWITAHLG